MNVSVLSLLPLTLLTVTSCKSRTSDSEELDATTSMKYLVQCAKTDKQRPQLPTQSLTISLYDASHFRLEGTGPYGSPDASSSNYRSGNVVIGAFDVNFATTLRTIDYSSDFNKHQTLHLEGTGIMKAAKPMWSYSKSQNVMPDQRKITKVLIHNADAQKYGGGYREAQRFPITVEVFFENSLPGESDRSWLLDNCQGNQQKLDSALAKAQR